MKANRKFIAISSIISGVLLFSLGIGSIGFYTYSVIDALDKADQSVIFWQLIFVFIGIALVILGIYFMSIGYKSSKEDSYTGLAKYSLGILGAISIVILFYGIYTEWSADKTRSERIKKEEVQKSLATEMHQIEQVKIDEFDQTGFSFSVDISEGVEGSYRLITSIEDGQAIFLEEAEEIELDSSKTKVIRSVNFKKLFQKCFNQFLGSNMYGCIENTGAKTFFTLESQLILIKDQQQPIAKISNNAELMSSKKIEFVMEIFTKRMEVKVNDFQPINH